MDSSKKKSPIDTTHLVQWILIGGCILLAVFCIRENFRINENVEYLMKENKALQSSFSTMIKSIEMKLDPINRDIDDLKSIRRRGDVPPQILIQQPKKIFNDEQTDIFQLLN